MSRTLGQGWGGETEEFWALSHPTLLVSFFC